MRRRAICARAAAARRPCKQPSSRNDGEDDSGGSLAHSCRSYALRRSESPAVRSQDPTPNRTRCRRPALRATIEREGESFEASPLSRSQTLSGLAAAQLPLLVCSPRHVLLATNRISSEGELVLRRLLSSRCGTSNPPPPADGPLPLSSNQCTEGGMRGGARRTEPLPDWSRSMPPPHRGRPASRSYLPYRRPRAA